MSATLPADLLASIVVFLVALPLCMGVAVASGMPAERGIVTGIVGGVLVGLIAGSPLQVSGPAAGLAVMTWELVQAHGLVGVAAVLTLAGLVQVAAGLLKLGGWFRATSPAVIQGMLAGIGVLIFAGQFHALFDQGPKGSGLANLAGIPATILSGLAGGLSDRPGQAMVVGLSSIAVLLGWNALRPTALKAVPGALLAVIAGAVAVKATGWDIKLVHVPRDLTEAVALPDALFLDLLVQPHMWGQSVQVALIASAETLLCAVAVDRMHNGPRTKFDRELLAQGIGNTICGLLGALPMTGVIVRSSANVDAGAKTRLSTILHGTWLLVMVALLPFVLELIPIASLAAILVVTGIKLVWTDAPRKLFAQSKAELAVFCATLVVIVAKDLLTGVVFGLGLAVALLVHRFAQMTIEVQPTADGARVRLVGNATFLRLPQLATALASIPRHVVLYLDLTELDYLDPACSEVIEDWRAEAKRVGGTLVTDEASLAGRKRRAGPVPSMDGAVTDAGDNA